LHFDGAVLFWEETRRATPAIWNDLHLLRLAGVFDRIAAMVVGIAQELPDGDGYPELREATLEALGDRPVPVLGHVDFGHAAPNLPLPLGIRAAVDADARTLTLLEPAVTAS
jgi:muramoyltetrapeptide carboxypeptidase